MATYENSPKKELEALTAELKQKEQDKAQATASVEYIKTRIAELTKTTGDIDQKVTAYEKVRPGLDEQRKKSESFVKAKKKLLEDTLPNEQEIVNKKKHGLGTLADIKDQLDELKTKVDEKQTAVDDAKKKLDGKKNEYTGKLDLTGSISKALKDSQDLEKLADQEGDKNNYARMYFYVLEMEDTLKEAELPTPEQYRDSLNQLAMDVENASNAHKTATDELDSTTAERTKKQKELDDKTAARREDTVKSIPEGTPTTSH